MIDQGGFRDLSFLSTLSFLVFHSSSSVIYFSPFYFILMFSAIVHFWMNFPSRRITPYNIIFYHLILERILENIVWVNKRFVHTNIDLDFILNFYIKNGKVLFSFLFGFLFSLRRGLLFHFLFWCGFLRFNIGLSFSFN